MYLSVRPKVVIKMMLRSRQGNNALSQNHAKTLDGETAMPVKRHATCRIIRPQQR
uniref:Uncharacterized protein n=1 Tax=Parascaris equorum TaxID=6256 RepID=A0A914RVT2_PAREQ